MTAEALNKLFWGTAYDKVTDQMNALSPNYVNPVPIAGTQMKILVSVVGLALR